MSGKEFHVIIFDSVSSTLLAEKILKKKDISHKVIPVPRHISSDCGVCIRFVAVEKDRIETALRDKVAIQGIFTL